MGRETIIIRPAHHEGCHIFHYLCQFQPFQNKSRNGFLQSVIHIASDHMFSHTETHTKLSVINPAHFPPVPRGWQWKVNRTAARLKQRDGADYCCGHRIKHHVHFVLNTDIDFLLSCSQLIRCSTPLKRRLWAFSITVTLM